MDDTIPKAYEWTFDRNPWDAVEGATRLSVGVYQWLPTKSGKSLKRSKSIRVHGFVADSARVYGRARGLCLRLNSEGVLAENPPEWLQKSYSVPRPTGVTLGRFSKGLTGAQVRSIREKVMQYHLIPQGFVKGKGGTYIRQRGEQIHLIDFQPSKYGGSYFVNLAFHYAFVPPLLQIKTIDLREYHLLDCGVYTRIESFMKAPQSDFKYGTDVDVLKSTFVSNVEDCLSAFAIIERKWKEPDWWLALFRSKGAFDSKSIAPWNLGHARFFALCIALYLKRFDIAQRQIERFRAIPNTSENKWKHNNQIIRKIVGNDRFAI